MIGYKDEYVKVVSFFCVDKYRQKKWNCICKCGNKLVRTTTAIHQKRNKYCAKCPRLDKKQYDRMRKHNYSYHPLYMIWKSINQRCYNSNSLAYKFYGKKGIAVCDDWRRDPLCFIEWSLSNGWEKGLTIDRINNKEDYAPLNCRFITRSKNSKKVHTDNQGLHCGSSHWEAKLIEVDVVKIKIRLLNGERPVDIVKDYPDRLKSIYQISENITWRHVVVPD